MAAARSEKRGVGSVGTARGDVVVSGGLKARGATVIFWSGAEAENQHHQSSVESYPGSRATEQASVKGVLGRNGRWGEGGTTRGFDLERESTAIFQRFDTQNSDHLTPVEAREI